MGTYPCSNCGTTADTATGCPTCGQSVQEEIAELSRLITQMQFRNAAMVEERGTLMKRLQGAIASRSLLQQTVAQERGARSSAKSARSAPLGRGAPSVVVLPRPAPTGTGGTPGTATVPTVTTGPTRPGRRIPLPRGGRPHGHPPETSTRTLQNALLWLGALLFAVTGTGYLLRELHGGARIAVFTVLAAAILAAPLPIVRRGLTSTAETLASVGLLFVLLDGSAVWSTGAPAAAGIPRGVFAGLVCLAATGVAAGYRSISRLVTPRFAAVLLLQPVLPLLLAGAVHGAAGWAAILSAVGALDLTVSLVPDGRGLGVLLGPPSAPPDGGTPRRSRGSARGGVDDAVIEATAAEVTSIDPDATPAAATEAVAAEAAEEIREHAAEGTPYLRDAVWGLHGLAVLAALICALVALAGAHTDPMVLGGAAGLLLAATVGLGGGLGLRRWPFPDAGAGLAVAAAIVALGRVVAVALPGWGLVVTALAIAVAGLAVPALRTLAPVGPRLAGLLAAGALGVVLLARGLPGIVAPLRAAAPPWHAHLDRYAQTVAHAASPGTGRLALAALILTAAAAIMLPRDDGRDAVVGGLTLTYLLVPAGFGLPWATVPLVGVLVAAAFGAYALLARTPRSAAVRIAAAALVGCYAAGVALARPDAAALALTGLTIAGAAVGAAPRLAEGGLRGPMIGVATDAGWGGAAFALPGALAFATAGTAQDTGSGPVPVLATAFLAVAGTLTATTVAQVVRERFAPLIAAGAALGTAGVAVGAFTAGGVPLVDIGVAALLLISALLMCLAPWVDRRWGAGRFGGGADLAATAVTAASIAAVARVAGLVAPGYQLVTAAVLVLLVAGGIRAMPEAWRRGPVVGGSLVGGVVGAISTVQAVRGVIATLGALDPVWHTDLGAWSARVSGLHGAQVPLALALLATAAKLVGAAPDRRSPAAKLVGAAPDRRSPAAKLVGAAPDRRSPAAAIALPEPVWYHVTAAGVSLAVLATPAALDLPWWSPILLSGVAATVTGVVAARRRVRQAAWAWFAAAASLFADTVAASVVRPAVTGQTLLAAAVILGLVAVTAGATLRAHPEAIHQATIGGLAICTALIVLPAGVVCLAWSAHAPWGFALTGALAGLAVGLALAAVACYDFEALLPYATTGVAVAGTAVALATIGTPLPLAVYAAAAALLAVLAELLRAAATARRAAIARVARAGAPRPGRPEGAGAGGAGRLGAVPYLGRVSLPGRPGYGPLLAAGPATVLAAVGLAPSVAAALFGPYRWLGSVWTGAPESSLAALGPLRGWVGATSSVAAALLLTVAGALGAVGFGGRSEVISRRAVAVVIPGLAVTLLIAPSVLHLGWPAGPYAAVLVAVVAGLGVALTAGGPGGSEGGPTRQARALVLIIGLLAGGAGLAGALATATTTLWSLAATAVAGGIAALRGHSRASRLVGWLIVAFAGHLLALCVGLAAGLPAYWSAFLVALVAAAMLMLASLLPRLRRPEGVSEAITVEASAYAGAVLALVLTAQSLPHLAAFACAWGAVLAVAAARPNRPRFYRHLLIWFATGHEVAAWWLLMHVAAVALPEAYTLAVAAAALVIGYVQTRGRDVSSWLAYGVALVAAFLPTMVIVLMTNETPLRRGLLIVGAALCVVIGSWRRQQAPVVVGGVTLAVAALHELAVVSTTALLWTIMALIGAVLVGLGANFEKRRRDLQRLRGALGRLR